MTITAPESDQLVQLGLLVRESRKSKGWTQSQLAAALGTSQSAVNRIERGNQNVSLEMLARVGHALGTELVSVGYSGPTHLRIVGGHQLSGSIAVNTSKNASVSLLCAALLNSGRTVLRQIARIEEVHRLIEVLRSIGVGVEWLGSSGDLEIIPPPTLDLAAMNVEAARRTRSIIMFLGPLIHDHDRFELPYAGGCALGTRTVEPHLAALAPFGIDIDATDGTYHVVADERRSPARPIVLVERGDTVTENALMAAARRDGVTVIRNASSNYMVQDLCFYLCKLGVQVDGIGTTTLTLHGRSRIDVDVDYAPSEDPIEAMSLITAAIATRSQLQITRVPIEFMEVELALLEQMRLRFDLSSEYLAENGRTRLADLIVHPSDLRAARDKIHPLPFPGLNIDNLPFFALIAATANGKTLVHDWVYENRAIYLTELNKLGASITLLDPHRVYVEGPTHWSGAEIICPPALRPAVVILLAMLAAKGTSTLRNVYAINRGYEQLAERLALLGAQIETFKDR
ncbi:UDP-N-acetylglucosamine 1-carboxyvinyltransferase [Nocardia sp. XZ_19_385]|uniref:UDP-N-acetylglucosamine 1-carboxyvinyltransferase n=1 Tax=Nocardia sp. XZ_19_385 TaxID=2769488 RepID=UPI00188E5503|nr:UDP-N-acetylglucosamine 1-carboxyvinyltransferase [Nocardia sp. XZ_19_385]